MERTTNALLLSHWLHAVVQPALYLFSVRLPAALMTEATLQRAATPKKDTVLIAPPHATNVTGAVRLWCVPYAPKWLKILHMRAKRDNTQPRLAGWAWYRLDCITVSMRWL
jgi:hypothetical protein